jgi:Gram-negative bacterial TonB protein C-terminal
MRKLGIIAIILFGLAVSAVISNGQDSSRPSLVQPNLTEPGSTPFYLQAVITERADPSERVDVELSWVAPDKWRRTIQSQEFTQTLIVNGRLVFEQDSDDYFPLGIQTLVTAMINPTSLLDAVRPGDQAMTKANSASDESGKMCFSPDSKLCLKSSYGLTESLRGPGRSVDFMDYQKFKDKRVARMLIYHIDPGDSLQARVNTLGELENHDEARFAVNEPTPRQKQIRSIVVPEAELRSLALQPTEIIWPQVLEDNQTEGETSYYVSLDRSGQVREILPLSVAIERADDSARRQIMKWKFNPLVRDGIPVQAEAVLNFHFNTRAYGPASPLTDVEVRKLVSNVVDPVFPPGAAPGSTYTIAVAVDAEGQVIESIALGGPAELFRPCSQAIGKWHFSPIREDGKPRPYRARITCRVP